MILTCRYLPAGTPTDLSTVMHLPLIEFAESDFRKFLRRDDVVEARIAGGALTAALLHSLYQAFGEIPGFLNNVRTLLRKADPDALRDDLEGISPEEPGDLSKARESYFMITSRLYEALSPDARDAARRLAVSELPLPVDAVARIVEAGAGALEPSLNACVAFGLLQRFDEAGRPSLYLPPGLLRPWLSDPERLPEKDARAIDRRLAAFWKSSFETNREAELRACRVHARRGGDIPTFRWATVRLGGLLKQRAEWFAARALLNEIPDDDHDAESLRSLASVEVSLGEWKTARSLLERARKSLADDRAGEAATWHNLATIDLNEGAYPAAREKFARSLEINQAIGDRAGAAATWHQLATIDLREGAYPAAREKLARSLEIEQAIGDRAGEAATFFQLGLLAHKLGRSHDGARLIAICYLINKAIGHGDAQSDFRNLAGLCQSLGYDQARFDAVLEEADREYQRDRGWALIERALAEGDARKAGGPGAAPGAAS
ncbi:MAG TPA: tetratricopeptide repeat protein [Isosphaeraceae bacterium]|nr:tetratricopeptide repeat protein [Isosphaeraceae bacterium]